MNFKGEVLGELPVDHPLRNQPLIKVKANFRYKGEKQIRHVRKEWKIAKVTFNDLTDAWTGNAIWYGSC